MGVPIELQDRNNESVPYLIAKCIEFVEKHGMKKFLYFSLSFKARFWKVFKHFGKISQGL